MLIDLSQCDQKFRFLQDPWHGLWKNEIGPREIRKVRGVFDVRDRGELASKHLFPR
jgi:hypothetical protein